MLKNYLKIALRNLRKHKGYTLINIAGLTVGIACCALILLFVRHELSYDRFHQKAGRIYRVLVTLHENGKSNRHSWTPAPMAPTLAEEYPEVLKAVRVETFGKPLVSYEGKQFYEEGVYGADPSLFEIFDFPLLRGNPETALQDPKSVVLSQAMAQKYFGNENPLGKVIQIERGGRDFQVTGILQEIPQASHLRPDFIIPFVNIASRLDNWFWFSFAGYVLLAEKNAAAALEEKLHDFVMKHYSDASRKAGFPKVSLGLQPLTDIHLRSDFDNEAGKLSAMTYLYLFVALALFIIAVACINFMNLATARSQHRAREVGVRKVIGGMRSQLVLQFISESVILALIATLSAIVLVEFFLPAFNALAQKELHLDYGSDGLLVGGFFLLALFVGVAAGSYPAFFLSRFQPVEVLKGSSHKGTSGARLRQLLVVGQFVISIALIACTIVVNNQIEFIRDKRLGFDKEQVVIVPLRGEQAQTKWPNVKTELLRYPEILSLAASSSIPADPEYWRTDAKRGDDDDAMAVFSYQIDYDFFKTLGIDLAAGRFLSPEFPGDSAQAFVLNEAAVKDFGYESAEAAIGQAFVWLGHGPDNPKRGTVVGVVKDFHFRPLYEEIAPAVFHLMPDRMYFIIVRVRPNSMKEALAVLKEKWQAFDPGHPLEFSFMDEKVEAQYGAETRLLKVFSIFSVFAIFISCLGLFGLVSFATEQRTKEIGIRKVLGASVSGIIFMLSSSFTKLVAIAFAVATPLAWWAMNKWLQNFAYRADLGWPVFALAGGTALLIALLTVGTQAIKAALANPVEALRYE
ncbi:ABC transporter permease [candidate division KSB1 bacterium]|nr:ABC transporter permease [candidate division KSB1 bacterium]